MKSLLSIIAIIAIMLFAGVFAVNTHVSEGTASEERGIQLSDASYGVTAVLEENPEEPVFPMLKLLELSESDLIRKNDLIIRGTVTNIQNIRINAGEVNVTRAIVTVTPSAVLKGSAAGNVTILANCPIDGSFQIEDTETSSAIRVGMEGIFMLQAYGDNELWELENAALRWKDLADYHFGDGRRYAFLATPSGLLYAEWAYPSLQAGSLDDVWQYLQSFIG